MTTDEVDFVLRVDVIDSADGDTVATWTRTQTVDSGGRTAAYLVDVAVEPFSGRPGRVPVLRLRRALRPDIGAQNGIARNGDE